MTNSGLSEQEAKEKIKIYGKNILNSYKVSPLKIFLGQFTSPLIYLLIIAAVVSFFLDSRNDAIAIGIILFINALLGFFQEYRSEKFIQKLESLIKKTVTVRRGGKEIEISESEIVPGDVVILKEGDKIPADGKIFLAETVLIDESVITGESIPTRKEENEKIFAGATIMHGYCEMQVASTGSKTELGKVATLTTKTIKTSKYQEGINNLSSFLMKTTFVALSLIFVANLLLKGFSLPHLETLFLFIITLAISIVPEALPVIATLTLSSGALKLAKRHVVVKRLTSVEDFGNIEVLCTDKTGTITENNLTVKDINYQDKEKFFSYLSMCLEDNNPIDMAVKKKMPVEVDHNIKKLSSLPFDPTSRRRWTLLNKDNKNILAVYGSAEEIVSLSSNIEKGEMASEIKNLESQGLRSLAIGYKEVSKDFSFDKPFDDKNIKFLGYYTLHDPIKESAKDAILLAEKLKIQIKIITGDSLEVAKYTARAIGLLDENDSKSYFGSQLSKFSEKDFEEACANGVVFAKITPEQKYKIIETLKKHFAVGYQGDGINDAPALKASNVGIAVNHAVDVAKEAADVILLRNDLKVLIEGIESGRKIFSNINKYIKHTMVSNWGNFFAIAVISLFTDFLPLLPIQIILASLFSDLPQIAVATDNVDQEDVKKPAHYNMNELITLPLILGLITTIYGIVFFLALRRLPLDYMRTFWVMLIIVRDTVIVISIRKNGWMFKGKLPSKTLSVSIMATILAIIILPYTFLGKVFSFTPLNIWDYVIIALSTIAYLLILDSAKMLYLKLHNKRLIGSPSIEFAIAEAKP